MMTCWRSQSTPAGRSRFVMSRCDRHWSSTAELWRKAPVGCSRGARRRPTGPPSLGCCVKEDCHTCNLVAPLLEVFHQTWAEFADIWVLGQSADGNLRLKDRHNLSLPILDDSACKTSFAWDFEIVPAIHWTDPEAQ